ncbi:Response regulator receiver domain-containing protein [Dyadobacter soli]|uniref:Response regulator receiver domain-containing protein n=1 Tax=Dyadobacter soli TaxID=659014 RepID=A0A1G7VFD5_9BACT|nr:response regulator [Dyadobacter soli]SDG58268.1 Response regulator receiver domain-containing protein [Dyadobacter soli]
MSGSCLVYLVDDDADYQYLVGQVFNIFLPQHRIRFFANGADLVNAIHSTSPTATELPAAILLDVDMPHMDGFQTLAAIKQQPGWQQINVIMMTNRDQAEYREESERLGAFAFLLKPISLPEIQKEMTQICETGGNFPG